MDLQGLAAANPGRNQEPIAGTTMALCSQFTGQMVREEDFLLRPALIGQVVDDSSQQWVVGL
jgi:hypothetical protein